MIRAFQPPANFDFLGCCYIQLPSLGFEVRAPLQLKDRLGDAALELIQLPAIGLHDLRARTEDGFLPDERTGLGRSYEHFQVGPFSQRDSQTFISMYQHMVPAQLFLSKYVYSKKYKDIMTQCTNTIRWTMFLNLRGVGPLPKANSITNK